MINILVTFPILTTVIIPQFLFPGEDKKLLDILQKLRNHESVYNYPIKMIKKSGETHRMLVDTNATFENDGSFAHARYFICLLSSTIVMRNPWNST